MPGFIEQEKWKSFLEEFSKRNQLRVTRIDVVGDIGAQEEEESLPLVGVTFEPKGTAARSVEIILGGASAKDKRHLEHLVKDVRRMAPIIGPTGLEDGLGFEDGEGGKTLLIFEQLPEIPEKTSAARQ